MKIDITNLVRKNIVALQPYSSARDEFKGNEGIFLDANENPFGSLNRYPDPYQRELKQKLSRLKNIDVSNIFIGNGSDEVIDLAFRIFCNPGIDKALTFSPTYGMYNVSASINNIKLIEVPLNEDFQIDLANLKPHLNNKHLKLIFICSPNNPTGNSINHDTVIYILNHFKGIVIIDEAYIDFSKNTSLLQLISKNNNLIVSQTFSKAWGLASARLGVAYANAKIIDYYNKVKPPYNVSKLNQQAAIEALNNYKKFEDNLALILREKKRLKEALHKIRLIKKIYPSDANFLLIKVEDANTLYSHLVAKKIITRNRHSVVANCLRITIGTPQQNNKLIKVLHTL